MDSRLREFADRVDRLLDDERDDRAVTSAVARLVEDLVSERDWLDESFQHPLPGKPYSQYPLHVDEDRRWSVVCFVWPAGSITPVHDHGVWGVVGIYKGQERETGFERVEASAREHRIRIRPDRSTTMMPGEVSLVLPPNDIHTVENTGSGVAVSIHVYGADIGRHSRHAFDRDTGEVAEFVSGYDTPVQNHA